MAEHASAAHGESTHGEHAHPTARKYLAVALILLVLTSIEVGVYYVPSLKFMLVPTLLVLSTVKFSIVAMFYMHLKFDSRLFSVVFVLPLIVAAIVALALMGLFGHFVHH